MAAYANNHIATASYLKGWADESGRLSRVLTTGLGESKLKRPNRVGFRRHFFSPEFAAAAEERFGSYENDGIKALRKLARSWPPDDQTRLDIAKLIAVHIVRNPAAHESTLRLSGLQLQRRLKKYRRELTEEQIGDLLRHLTSEEFMIGHMLDMVPKQTSLIASMHWTLLEFPLPLLATSDHPLTVIPALPEGETPQVVAIPPTGYLMTEEIRFAIGPERALLFTWLNDVESDKPVMADHDCAAELNRAVIAQAEREWFHHPDRRATRLKLNDFDVETCSGLAHRFIQEYSATYALESPRRIHASQLVNRMIQERITDEFLIARVRRTDADASTSPGAT